MLRNNVDLSSPSKMLETLLQNRLGLKYMQSKKLVAAGREKLGMEKSSPWTPELEAECLKIYEAEHGPIQPRDYSTPEKSAVSGPPKSFTPSTPAPAKPVVKEEARDPEPVPQDDTPELTPEDEEEPAAEEEAPKPEEPPKVEEEEEEVAAPEPEPEAPEPKQEEEEEKVVPAKSVTSSDDDDSDDDSDDSDDE